VISEKLPAHLGVDRYGDFVLTGAVRPGPSLPVVPVEGYRCEFYRDQSAGTQIPVLIAAVSSEKLFDCFLDLLRPLGEVVDVVLETSHQSHRGVHRDLVRESIDLPVLMSWFCDFEELLLRDGCTGTAILSSQGPLEVQFDEHKLLIVYAHDLEPFVEVLERYGVRCRDDLKLITEGEHVHSTEPHHEEEFEQLCCRVGVAELAERVNWSE
jgi:hypothetical protein